MAPASYDAILYSAIDILEPRTEKRRPDIEFIKLPILSANIGINQAVFFIGVLLAVRFGMKYRLKITVFILFALTSMVLSIWGPEALARYQDHPSTRLWLYYTFRISAHP